MNLCLGFMDMVTTLFEALESLESSDELLNADGLAVLAGLGSRSLGALVVEVVVVEVVVEVEVVLVVVVVLVVLLGGTLCRIFARLATILFSLRQLLSSSGLISRCISFSLGSAA